MIKTRFCPSPTGMLHLGNVRAALFSALYAARHNGHLVLRIEDTDAARSENKYAEILQEDLKWLGVKWQEGPGVEGPNGPYWQSQRHEIYAKYYQFLEENHLAFPCFCSEQELAMNRKIQLSRGKPPRYPGTCYKLSKEEVIQRLIEGKKPALRFHIPAHQMIEFVDSVKGPQKFNSDDIGDFIIRRAEGSASFMFCNAIDDSLMGVTNVLRGEDHLSNTPRQMMILQALKMPSPAYGHLSMITGDDGTPLSKRHGSSSLHDLRDQKYLPAAVLNYLARLSHAYEQQHLMTFEELAANFDLTKISRAPARFDKNQLLHWQKEAVMALNTQECWNWFGADIQKEVPANLHDDFLAAVRPNITFPYEAKEWADILFKDLSLDFEKQEIIKSAGEEFFSVAAQAVGEYSLDLKTILEQLKKLNVSGKSLFMPLRIALTGQLHGPELALVLNLIGQDKAIKRLEHASEIAHEGVSVQSVRPRAGG
jgi:nondiscriminating glutamyl-tRNA synthetase